MRNEPTADILARIPQLYETEHIPLADKVIHLHFFLGHGGYDAYIAEYNGEDIMFGFVILNGDYQNAEWGYISFREIRELKIYNYLEIENDLFWVPKAASMVEAIRKAHRWPRPPQELSRRLDSAPA